MGEAVYNACVAQHRLRYSGYGNETIHGEAEVMMSRGEAFNFCVIKLMLMLR